MTNTIAIISILIGLVLSLFGYKVQKAVITLAWFLIGYGISNYICPNFITNEYLIIGINILIGLLLSSIGFKLEKLALVIAVSYFAYSSIKGMINLDEPTICFIIEVTLSMIIGLVSLLFLRPIIIIVTAGYGSSLIKDGIITLIPTLTTNIALIIVIAIFLLTILYQFKTTK